MSFSSRLFQRMPRHAAATRFLSTTPRLSQDSVPLNSRANDTAKKHREFMLKKPLNPHMTNTNSTIANELPSVGADKPPADMLSSVDPSFVPKDSVPENTERMLGGTQSSGPKTGPNAELNVGEIEGSKVKIEPLKREGETEDTLRARLTCPLSFSLFLCRTQTLIYPTQIKAAKGERSKVIFSSPPLQIRTSEA